MESNGPLRKLSSGPGALSKADGAAHSASREQKELDPAGISLNGVQSIKCLFPSTEKSYTTNTAGVEISLANA